MRHQIIKFLILVGTIFLMFFGSLLVLIGVTFFFNQPIGWYHLPAAAILALIGGWFMAQKYFPRQYDLLAVSVLCVVATFVFALRISGYFYDTSWDGQTYHAEAIARLASGWNPVKLPLDSTMLSSEWISYYPKGPWIISAALVKLLATLNPLNASNPYKALAVSMEQGKAMNLLLMAASLCFALAAMLSLRRLKWYTAASLGILLVLNPITINQTFTQYVDGQLASCLLILMSLVILLYRRHEWALYTAFTMITLITINVKLTSGVYVAILGGGFVVWYCLTRKLCRLPLVICLIVGCLLGGIMVGYNPYITQYAKNLVEHRDPFYPTTLGALTQLDTLVPSNYTNFPPWKRFVYSLLAEPGDVSNPVTLKMPFTSSPDEFNKSAESGAYIAEFGPLFSGIFILAIIVSGLLTLTTLRQKRSIRSVSMVVPIIFLLLVSVLINPEAWKERYIPQLWLIPILLAALTFSKSPHGHLYGLTYIMVALIWFNVLGFSYYTLGDLNFDRIAVPRQMAVLWQQSRSPGPLYVSLGLFVGTRYRLIANDVNFLEVQHLPCPISVQQHIFATQASYCVAPPATGSSQ